MDKSKLIDALLAALRDELEHAVGASRDAADYATNEESRAESEWDTQGLEASYLAAGQASQARQWAAAIESINGSRHELARPCQSVTLGALIGCDVDGSEEFFFYTRVAGGHTIEWEGRQVTVITSKSPLAERLLGRESGDLFQLPSGVVGRVKGIW